MIQSMTGYGRVEFNLKNKNFTVEIKSLNSKTTDFNLKLPVIYRNKEIILRKILSEKLKRGKVELSIWFEKTQTNTPYEFDKKLILKYYKQLNSIKQDLGLKANNLKNFFCQNNIDLMPIILKMPDVLIKKDEKVEKEIIASGLPASPGAASGKVVFTADEAEKLNEMMQDTILVRLETSPEDIHGMHAAKGILTARGGMTSHAAVVARGMGRPCVSGSSEITIDYETKQFKAGNEIIKEGDIITIDGGSGKVMKGLVPTVQPEISG